MRNESEVITEKHWQKQLPLPETKQTFCDTAEQYPRRRKI